MRLRSIAITILLAALAVMPPAAQTTEYGPPLVITEAFQVPAGLGLDTANGRVLAETAGPSHRARSPRMFPRPMPNG